jgi:uncharacterized membrane protein YgcG
MGTQAGATERKPEPESQRQTRRFQWRALISVTTILSFLVMSVTGAVLFVTPPGRIAHWTGWTFSGLDKDQWAALHIWFSLVFLLAAGFHIYLNWRPLVSYFKDRARKAFALRWEWVVSLALCVLVWVGTLSEVTPFSNLLALNDRIKHSWDQPGQRAPIPHAELMTLNEVAEKVEGLDGTTMMQNLQDKGIEVASPNAVVGELAQQNNMTPNRLYALAINERPRGAGQGGNWRFSGRQEGRGGLGAGRQGGGGFGIGRLTLRQYCEQEGLDVETAVAKLKENNVEANPDTTIREIADNAGLHPSVIRDILGR